MKTILTEIFSSRSSYRLRDNRFKHCIGGPPINPYLKNSYQLLQSIDHSSATIHPETGESITIRPTVDEAIDRSMYWMACSGQQPAPKRKHMGDDSINLRHLLYCLKTNRNLIPVLSVQCSAYYRTAAKLDEIDTNSAND
ncbi:unnamed protein product [Medioppia subpectinata]|uniref:Uncharacterized protein n=1 Tax=Medioppia subpectinata TaxID=1979941 RepID=A0A7R9L1D5_9ACAR|nr:unnamed protein product [Medioppia subpectinata]CAG2113533.1 unnamed protein product [Medioppia subpectinata]